MDDELRIRFDFDAALDAALADEQAAAKSAGIAPTNVATTPIEGQVLSTSGEQQRIFLDASECYSVRPAASSVPDPEPAGQK